MSISGLDQSQAAVPKTTMNPGFNHKDLATQNDKIEEEIDEDSEFEKPRPPSQHTDPEMINLMSQQNQKLAIESQ